MSTSIGESLLDIYWVLNIGYILGTGDRRRENILTLLFYFLSSPLDLRGEQRERGGEKH